MIRTERLFIVPLRYEEAVSRVYSYSGMVTNDEEKDNFVKYSLEPMKLCKESDIKWFTIWDAKDSDGNRVLECGFICPPTENNVVEVWCYTDKRFMNKGFGTEAINGLFRFCEAFESIKYVCASVSKDNIASQKMMTKAGFYYLADTPSGMMVFNKHINN